MNREELKELGLSDEQVEAVMKAHGKATNDIRGKADKVDSLESQIENLNSQIQDRDTQLEGLKEKAKDGKELSDEIDRLKDENKQVATDWQQKLDQQKKDFAVQSALRDANVHDPEIAQKALDVDSISLKEGKLIGFDEQLNDLKENKSFLFKQEDPPGLKGRNPHPSNPNNPAPENNPFSKDNFNLTEQGKLVRDDPDKAKQLISQAGQSPANFGL